MYSVLQLQLLAYWTELQLATKSQVPASPERSGRSTRGICLPSQCRPGVEIDREVPAMANKCNRGPDDMNPSTLGCLFDRSSPAVATYAVASFSLPEIETT